MVHLSKPINDVNDAFLSKLNSRIFDLNRVTILYIIFMLTMFHAAYKYKQSLRYHRSSDSTLIDYVKVSSAAANLPSNGNLFCWVMTSSRYHTSRALSVNETWLPRCDHGVVFTNDHFGDNHKGIPYRTVFAGIPDAYENLFFKTRFALYYIRHHMSADFDWYLKADDDTYIVMENLRKFLSNYDPTIPYYFGYRLKPHLKHGFNGGGGGYVLSRAAIDLFVHEAYRNATVCPDDVHEDVGLARCLESMAIYPYKTINEKGQQRFNTYHWKQTMQGFESWEEWIVDWSTIRGYDGIASDLISFHHLDENEMRLFDILLYRVKVNGECEKNEENSAQIPPFNR